MLQFVRFKISGNLSFFLRHFFLPPRLFLQHGGKVAVFLGIIAVNQPSLTFEFGVFLSPATSMSCYQRLSGGPSSLFSCGVLFFSKTNCSRRFQQTNVSTFDPSEYFSGNLNSAINCATFIFINFSVTNC